VGWITDDGLIEVANLDFHMFRGVGDEAEIAEVAVAANPDGEVRPAASQSSMRRAIRCTLPYCLSLGVRSSGLSLPPLGETGAA
jgi:hypothetical protein